MKPRVLWEDATARVVLDRRGTIVVESWDGKDAMGASRWTGVGIEAAVEVLHRALQSLASRDPSVRRCESCAATCDAEADLPTGWVFDPEDAIHLCPPCAKTCREQDAQEARP